MVDRQAGTIADAWYRVIGTMTTDAVGLSGKRGVVDGVARRIVEMVHGQVLWSPHALDDLADEILALQLPYRALASLQEILISELIEEPSRSGHPPVRARPLIGALTASLLRCQEPQVLDEQELIDRAHGRAYRWEHRRLRLADAAVQSFGMLQERIDRLRALHNVDRGILAARSPAAIGEAALQHIRQLVPCHRASVILFAPDGESARYLAAVPESEFPESMGRDFPLRGFDDVIEALRRGELTAFDDPRRLGAAPGAVEQQEHEDSHTHAAVPLRCDATLLGCLELTIEWGTGLTRQQHIIVREIADSLSVAILQAQLNATVARHEARLRALTARLAEGDEAERRRLSRDLHDDIGQKLTALGINLNVVKAQLGPQATPRLVRRLDDSLGLVTETTERVRRVIGELRPPMLDEYGLLPTVRWCADQLAARTDVEVVVRGEQPDPRLPARVEDALVRITQEALTNVAKHARATRVIVALAETADGVRLTISDDGVGFEREVLDQSESPHWGLLTMTERAAAVDGRCAIESEPGEGTQVIVEVGR